MSEFSLILVLRKENKQNSDITWQFSSLYRSRSFPSAPTLTAKVSIILDTAKLLAMFFYPEGQKKALNAAFAEKKILPHFYSMATIQCPMPIYHLLQESKQTVTIISSPPSPFWHSP